MDVETVAAIVYEIAVFSSSVFVYSASAVLLVSAAPSLGVRDHSLIAQSAVNSMIERSHRLNPYNYLDPAD